MSDEISDPREEYRKTVKTIETLSRLILITSEEKRRTYLEGQLARLRRFKEQLESSFEVGGADEAEADESEEGHERSEANLRYLNGIRWQYEQLDAVRASKDKEIQNLVIYMTHFEQQYVTLFDKKRLDLDHMSSQELDGFYTSFNQAKRRMEIFTNETEALFDEKKGGHLLQHLKAKQALLVEVYKFFKKIQKFTGEMLEDIAHERRHCFNGDAKLSLSLPDRKMILNGLRVRDALKQVNGYATEVIDYLDIPDFQK